MCTAFEIKSCVCVCAGHIRYKYIYIYKKVHFPTADYHSLMQTLACMCHLTVSLTALTEVSGDIRSYDLDI